MSNTIARVVKWVSLPLLLIASLFSPYAARYELAVNLVVCFAAVVLVQRAVRSNQYLWAAGLVAIAVVFSPFVLLTKVFMLMGLTCVATCATLLAVFRTQRLLAWHPEVK